MTISEFLRESRGSLIVSEIPTNLRVLVDDHMLAAPGTVEFMGVIKKEFNLWNEYSILYKFPKASKNLGSNIKSLGTMISHLPLDKYNFGIQEVDPTQSDGYYILLYALEEIEFKEET